MSPTPILFCSHVVELGGAEMVLLDLFGELDRELFVPHLAVPGDGPLVSGAAKLGVAVHRVPLSGRSKLGKARAILKSRASLRQLAAHLDCRVLVANSMIAGYAAVLAQQRGLACIWHLHAVTTSRIARAALHRAAAVIAPSLAALDAAQLTTGNCIANGVPDRFFQSRDSEVASGTPVGTSELRARHDIPAAAALLGILGRLDPHKGHEVLLRSLAAEWRDGPPPHLVIAGGELFSSSQARLGGFGDRLRRQVQTLGLDQRVHWLGEVSDTSTLLPQLDALVVPSISLESAPRTIAEAQAAGCPVIASAVGGIADMLANGEAGMLVPANDSDALSKALRHVLGNSEWRNRAILAGRRRADEHYRLAAFARRCEAVLAQANAAATAELSRP